MQKRIGPAEVVAMFIVGMFALGLLIFTAIANLALLTRIYPDPQFVGFGLLALEGGTVVWTVISFLTNKRSPHFGICLVGLGVDTLLSFTGFMYEMAGKTGTSLPINMPVIYVVGFAVVFNIAAGLCYKLVPRQPGIQFPQYYPQPLYEPQRFQQMGNYFPQPGIQFPQQQQLPAPQGGVSVDPLAEPEPEPVRTRKPKKPMPKFEPVTMGQTASMGAIIKEGANSLMQKGMERMKIGTREGRVPGNQNATTSENTSSPTASQSQADYEDNEL